MLSKTAPFAYPEQIATHLLGIQELPLADIRALLDLAASLPLSGPEKKILPARAQGGLVNLFLENSTRTRISFELAAQRLGMPVVNMSAEGSSILKGETLVDTIETLAAMRPAALVIRASEPGSAQLAARTAARFGVAVINAGDGTGEHPTQALLDALTILEAKGRIDGLKIVICGDIRHSRVARSNSWLLPRLGAALTLAGPRELLPETAREPGWNTAAVRYSTAFDEALQDADIVMMLRIQKERLGKDIQISPGEYQANWRLDHDRLARLAPRALVMHPGPINRDVELTGVLADDAEKSLILKQVAAGVRVRMAILMRLLGIEAA